MKNYKHSVKSGNAMKLAAVASAAIMMAPVALNSVSAFASDSTATTTTAKATYGTMQKLQEAVTAANALLNTDAAKNATSANSTKQITKLTNQVTYAQAALDGKKVVAGTNTYDYTNGVTEEEAAHRYDTIITHLYTVKALSENGQKVFATVPDAVTNLLANDVAADKAKAEQRSLQQPAARKQAAEAPAAQLSSAATSALTTYTKGIAGAVASDAGKNLMTAIKDAQAAATSLSGMTTAGQKLTAALTAFERANATATQAAAEEAAKTNAQSASAANVAALSKAIEKATALYGENVKTNAPAAAAAGFAAQIKGAESVKDNIVKKNLTNKDVTSATADLNKAAAAFATAVATKGSQNEVNDFKQNEAKTTAVKEAAKSALETAIDNAKKSEVALSSYKGANAATVKAFNNFDGVIKAAQVVYESADSTPAALNAAAANVAKAAATLGNDVTLATSGNDLASAKKAEAAKLANKVAAQKVADKLAAAKDKLAHTKTGVAHVNYAKGYGIQVWTKDHKIVRNADGSAKKLGGETNWKVFGSVQNFGGKLYYCVGGNQYVDADYVTVAFNLAK